MDRRKKLLLLTQAPDLVWQFPDGLAPVGFEALLPGATWAGKAATALVRDGHEMLGNPELSLDTAGWLEYRVSVVRVDSEIDPGASSGGADKWAAKVTKTTSDATCQLYQALGSVVILGGRYRISSRAYAPSSNVAVLAAQMDFTGVVTPQIAVSAEDTWNELVGYGTCLSAGANSFRLMPFPSSTPGDMAYFDSASCQLMLAPFVSPPRRPNGSVRQEITWPASGVIPHEVLFRATSELNRWGVRCHPNTAGDDTHLGYRNAGEWTTVASADVDWTSDGTDQIRVVYFGETIEVYTKKQGESAWTLKIRYDSASYLKTGLRHGWDGYATSGGPLLNLCVVSDGRAA